MENNRITGASSAAPLIHTIPSSKPVFLSALELNKIEFELIVCSCNVIKTLSSATRKVILQFKSKHEQNIGLINVPNLFALASSALKLSIVPYLVSMLTKSMVPGELQSKLFSEMGDRITASAPIART